MSLRTALVLGLLAVPAAAAPFAAQGMRSQDDPGPMINDPNPATFQVYGIPSAPKSVKDESVQGGRALNVPVTGSGTPYAVGVNVPLNKPVKAGDQLTVMFYAKLQKAEPGVTSAKVTAQVQLSSAPYTAIAGKPFDVPTEWKLFTVTAVADKDYSKGSLTAAFHINTGKQTIGLGLVAVFAKPK
jgi:hypothetical protein